MLLAVPPSVPSVVVSWSSATKDNVWIAYIPINWMGRENIGPACVLDNDSRHGGRSFRRRVKRWNVVPEGDIKYEARM